ETPEEGRTGRLIDDPSRLIDQLSAASPCASSGRGSALPGGSASLHVEAELSEHRDGARLPAFEIAGGKALARGELIGGAQDRLGRVAAVLPDQGVGRRRGGGGVGEERLPPQTGGLPCRRRPNRSGHPRPSPPVRSSCG